jgi:hypothetical protein
MDATGLAMLGTLRKDGSPRVTPVEFGFFDDDLWVGMMWQSRKAMDLLRDPRFDLLSSTTDKDATAGDGRLSGLAVDEPDPARKERYGRGCFEETGWRPQDEFHLFTLDIRAASFVVFSKESVATIGDSLDATGVQVRRRVNADSDYLTVTWHAR